MKMILFLIVCLMSFSAKADNSKVCAVTRGGPSPNTATTVWASIMNLNCQSNNILFVTKLGDGLDQQVIRQFCRYDREIVIREDEDELFGVSLTCVLNSTKPRERLQLN